MAYLSRPTRARGLKFARDRVLKDDTWSRPTRARGLKSKPREWHGLPPRSRPTRARGLKSRSAAAGRRREAVAPHTGAWIEMCIQAAATA